MESVPFDLVLRGEVIDPALGLRGARDVGIRDGRIAAVEPSLEGQPRREFLDYTGAFLSPGFVDIHAHIYAGVTSWGTKPDPACLSSGVTTVVDAGSPGWTMLQGYRWLVHERSAVRALCFLHISGIGLVNAWVNECEDIRHLDPRTVGEHAAENADMVVGIKVRQGKIQVGEHGVEPLRRAIRAAEIASAASVEVWKCGSVEAPPPHPHTPALPHPHTPTLPHPHTVPVMCHIAAGISLADVLELLRPGDIITHCFQGRGEPGENVTDTRGRLLPEVVDARQKGVVMDVGHGGGSFRWGIAEAALEQGFLPDVISTDLHAFNLHGPMFDMATCLTKFLYLGLPLEQVIEAATAAPARSIGRPELGTLAVGSPADLAVFRIAEEPVELWDTHYERRTWDRRVKVEATVCGGVVHRADEQVGETEAEIDHRCRKRGPDALIGSWREGVARGAGQAERGGA